MKCPRFVIDEWLEIGGDTRYEEAKPWDGHINSQVGLHDQHDCNFMELWPSPSKISRVPVHMTNVIEGYPRAGLNGLYAFRKQTFDASRWNFINIVEHGYHVPSRNTFPFGDGGKAGWIKERIWLRLQSSSSQRRYALEAITSIGREA
jgi:hypothetical protein